MIFEIIIIGIGLQLIFGDFLSAKTEYYRERARELERLNDKAENGDIDESI